MVDARRPPPGPRVRRRRAGRCRRPWIRGLAADRGYLGVTALAAVFGLAVIGYLIWKTVSETGDIWSTFGVWGFLTGHRMDPQPGRPASRSSGPLPFIYGTLVTSAIAMVVAVPLAIGVALATTVFLPKRMRGAVASVVDLLAAVPSVVYGLWGCSCLVPAARPALEWISEHSGGLGAFAGPVTSGSFILAGPGAGGDGAAHRGRHHPRGPGIVPVEQQEAALALGATRWEMVRHAMLPWARSGIVGASASAWAAPWGRPRDRRPPRQLAQARGLPARPGLDPRRRHRPGARRGHNGLQLSALTALAVVLFVLALIINVLARILVARGAAGPGPVRRAIAGRLRPAGTNVAEAEAAVVERPPAAAAARLPSVSRSRRIRSDSPWAWSTSRSSSPSSR